ncbi:MAG TPA: hypothetical protein PKJ24_01810 [Prolixibacteraceae bacterium]|nr:hypothetical protein [Prolixibacteraceae bacterium]
MKNKNLNMVWMAVAILLISVIISPAQKGFRSGNGNYCCNNIPGLTEEQKSGILKLQQEHRTEMQQIRNTWRSSATPEGREAHLALVSQKVNDHRNAVRSLLNEDQKAAFGNTQRRGLGNFGKGNSNGKRNTGMRCANGGQGWRHRYGWSVNN